MAEFSFPDVPTPRRRTTLSLPKSKLTMIVLMAALQTWGVLSGRGEPSAPTGPPKEFFVSGSPKTLLRPNLSILVPMQSISVGRFLHKLSEIRGIAPRQSSGGNTRAQTAMRIPNGPESTSRLVEELNAMEQRIRRLGRTVDVLETLIATAPQASPSSNLEAEDSTQAQTSTLSAENHINPLSAAAQLALEHEHAMAIQAEGDRKERKNRTVESVRADENQHDRHAANILSHWKEDTRGRLEEVEEDLANNILEADDFGDAADNLKKLISGSIEAEKRNYLNHAKSAASRDSNSNYLREKMLQDGETVAVEALTMARRSSDVHPVHDDRRSSQISPSSDAVSPASESRNKEHIFVQDREPRVVRIRLHLPLQDDLATGEDTATRTEAEEVSGTASGEAATPAETTEAEDSGQNKEPPVKRNPSSTDHSQLEPESSDVEHMSDAPHRSTAMPSTTIRLEQAEIPRH